MADTSKTDTIVHEADYNLHRAPERGRCTLECKCGEVFRETFDERIPGARSAGVNKVFADMRKHTESFWVEAKGIVLPKDRAISLVGEGVHTGLRKGTDAQGAHKLWKAIRDDESTAWSDAAAYFVETLDYMGYAIVKVEK